MHNSKFRFKNLFQIEQERFKIIKEVEDEIGIVTGHGT
jgi:hypothetical protein